MATSTHNLSKSCTKLDSGGVRRSGTVYGITNE